MTASISIIKHSRQSNLVGLALNYTWARCSLGLKCKNNSVWLTCAANSFDTSSQTSPLYLKALPCARTWVQLKPCQIKQARQVGPFLPWCHLFVLKTLQTLTPLRLCPQVRIRARNGTAVATLKVRRRFMDRLRVWTLIPGFFFFFFFLWLCVG